MILAKLRRRQTKPSAYNTELRLFLRAFRRPKTRRQISLEAIDKFKAPSIEPDVCAFCLQYRKV